MNVPDSYSPKDNFAKGVSGISAQERGVFPFISMLQLNSRHRYFPGVRRGSACSCVRACCSWHRWAGSRVLRWAAVLLCWLRSRLLKASLKKQTN